MNDEEADEVARARLALSIKLKKGIAADLTTMPSKKKSI